jgi:hypothetical protein
MARRQSKESSSILPRVELPLVITVSDLDSDLRNALAAKDAGGRLLGGEGTLESIYEELPSAIARRIKKITPLDFRVAKVTLKMQLDVNIPGVKVGGTVDVTLKPSK